VRSVMESHIRLGDRAGSVSVFRAFAQRLRSDLGTEPSPETQAICDRAADPDAGSAARMALPAESSTFFGREAEVALVRSTISENRATTLAGPGGVGKTRLAIRAARDAATALRDGVAFVELSSTGPDGVRAALDAVCDRLRLPRDGDSIGARLARCELLLLIDTAEHVLVQVAEVAAEILRSAPAIRLLVTSREPLGIEGERVIRVDPLPVPADPMSDVATLGRSPAFALFLDRAKAGAPTFRATAGNAGAIAQICRRLDGLPLAIELAAARTSVLTAHELLVRLDDELGLLTKGRNDAPSRHRTLRATLEWSCALLGDAGRSLFARLGVFNGGWTLDAVERVCLPQGSDALDALTMLIDESLVLVDDREGRRRYRFLDTTRAYAAELLGAPGAEGTAVRARHAQYFASLVAHASPTQLDQERDNIRAALEHGIDGDAELALRIGVGMWYYWLTHGMWREGRRWLSAALSGGEDRAPRELVIRARHRLANLTRNLGEFDEAAVHYVAVIRSFGELGDRNAEGEALRGQAAMLIDQCRFPEARHALARGLNLYRHAERRDGEDSYPVASTYHTLGRAAVAAGDLRTARRCYERCLRAFERLGDERMIANTIQCVAAVSTLEGDDETAVRLLHESMSRAQSLGDEYLVALAHVKLSEAALLRGDVDGARKALATALACEKTLAEATGILLRTLECVAGLALAFGDASAASSLSSSAQAARERLRMPMPPIERTLRTQIAQRYRPITARGAARLQTIGEALAFARAFVACEPVRA
jgi:predicted ATPase